MVVDVDYVNLADVLDNSLLNEHRIVSRLIVNSQVKHDFIGMAEIDTNNIVQRIKTSPVIDRNKANEESNLKEFPPFQASN
ncbi:hypothetical protein V6N12_052084 [Hibiscus sabdariffa]|uniref:Uncharacterized protein n=1 Tax=Hibiscus sabdariffa TaxID=183260 RepID=A0ABR2GHT8_9ROSI